MHEADLATVVVSGPRGRRRRLAGPEGNAGSPWPGPSRLGPVEARNAFLAAGDGVINRHVPAGADPTEGAPGG